MYRNQYEYDNAEPQGPSLREIAEENIRSQIENGDADLISKAVEQAAMDMTIEAGCLLEALLVVSASKFHEMVQALNKIDPDTADGLFKLGGYVDSKLEDFISTEAEEMLREAAE